MTETGALTGDSTWVTVPAGSTGVARPEWEIQIVDEQDGPLPVNQVGEILCRPRRPFVMFDGYWGRPNDTLRVLRNLWFHTGDLGRLDDDGVLYFVDRKNDYMRRRGENISSVELEAAFLAHDDVAQVAAFGVPSPLGEDDVQIAVVLKPGAQLEAPELCRWCLDKVPYYAVPRYFQILDALPTTPVGRVLKTELRAKSSAGRWDREKAGVVIDRR
jgi:crotonobetaine/carnitine-CoA ligase